MLLAKSGHTCMKISFCFENKLSESASLYTGFYDCRVTEGSFGWTKTSLSDFSFL